MDGSIQVTSRTLWILVLAMLWVFVSTMVAGVVISGLPRPVQGESPEGSRLFCVGLVLLIQFTVPCLLIAFRVEARALRIAGFLATMFAMLAYHRFFDGLALLDKAWRRGF